MVTLDVFAVLIMGVLLFCSLRTGAVLMTYRGIRVITCPGTGQSAAVELVAWGSAIRSVLWKPVLRIHTCSGWPERRNCDQSCVRQIAAAPADSLISNILARWYQDRSCVCCGTPLRQIHAGRHEPGLLSPERRMIEWQEIPPQKVPEVLATAGPVCRNCVVAETHTWYRALKPCVREPSALVPDKPDCGAPVHRSPLHGRRTPARRRRRNALCRPPRCGIPRTFPFHPP